MVVTYVVRIAVRQDEIRPGRLTASDFSLTHPYEGMEVVAVNIDKDDFDYQANHRSDVEDVCPQCFGNLDQPTYRGYPMRAGNCHQAFPVSPTQGVLA